MPSPDHTSTCSVRPPRVGYVVKRFSRLSATFVLNEIREPACRSGTCQCRGQGQYQEERANAVQSLRCVRAFSAGCGKVSQARATLAV